MSEVITTSTTDITSPTLTKEEIRKQKRAIYQKEYMIKTTIYTYLTKMEIKKNPFYL